jgi:pyruvate formate lyase activating enzyme
LHALSDLRRRGLWIEVSTVVIPGVNDSDQELEELAGHLAAHIGPDTPWHVMKFFPYGGLRHLPPTPLATLRRARTIGLTAGLRHVYLGNMKASEEQSTCCPKCGNVLIRRSGTSLLACALADGACPACGTAIPGYWLAQCMTPAPPAMTNHETNSYA